MKKAKHTTLLKVLGKKKLDELIRTFNYLAMRWEDESAYEDLKDYGKLLAKIVSTPVKMSDRPLMARFRLAGLERYMHVHGDSLTYGSILPKKTK